VAEKIEIYPYTPEFDFIFDELERKLKNPTSKEHMKIRKMHFERAYIPLIAYSYSEKDIDGLTEKEVIWVNSSGADFAVGATTLAGGIALIFVPLPGAKEIGITLCIAGAEKCASALASTEEKNSQIPIVEMKTEF
jgi:hypothetical protein